MLDLNSLEQFFGADSGETYYLDRQTGEVLASRDMFPEELENRKRFLQVPDFNSPEAASNELEEFQQYMREVVYEPDLHIRLEEALQNGTPLVQCERILLDYYSDLDGWYGFQDELKRKRLMKWLSSKEIKPSF